MVKGRHPAGICLFENEPDGLRDLRLRPALNGLLLQGRARSGTQQSQARWKHQHGLLGFVDGACSIFVRLDGDIGVLRARLCALVGAHGEDLKVIGHDAKVKPWLLAIRVVAPSDGGLNALRCPARGRYDADLARLIQPLAILLKEGYVRAVGGRVQRDVDEEIAVREAGDECSARCRSTVAPELIHEIVRSPVGQRVAL